MNMVLSTQHLHELKYLFLELNAWILQDKLFLAAAKLQTSSFQQVKLSDIWMFPIHFCTYLLHVHMLTALCSHSNMKNPLDLILAGGHPEFLSVYVT